MQPILFIKLKVVYTQDERGRRKLLNEFAAAPLHDIISFNSIVSVKYKGVPRSVRSIVVVGDRIWMVAETVDLILQQIEDVQERWRL